MRVCLVVPAAGDHTSHVAAAVRLHHPDAELSAVWAGDPHLRPPLPQGARWIDDDLAEPTGVGWGRLLVACEPRAFALARAAAAVSRLITNTAAPAIVLTVGDVVVRGALDDLIPASGVVLARHTSTPLAVDGLAPGTVDLLAAGRFATAAFGVAPDAAPMLAAAAGALADIAPEHSAGAAFATVIDAMTVPVRVTLAVHAVGWQGAPDHEPAVLDVSWLEDDGAIRVATSGQPARVRMSGEPHLARWLSDGAPQWVGVDRSLRLAGGLAVDATTRSVVAGGLAAWRRGESNLPPDPWAADGPSLLEWLETPWPPWGADVGRYWSHLHGNRPDLVAAFPDPDRDDRRRFAAWADSSWRHEPRSRLLRATSRPLRPPWHDAGRDAGGVNLIGYHGFDNSLGDVVRRMQDALTANGFGVAAVHYHRSGSPPLDPSPPGLTDELRYDVNLIVVNADQIDNVDADYGEVLWSGRRNIGYWFWDVEYVPPTVIAAARHLDEIWVASPFTANALSAVVDCVVRVVDVPVPEPHPAQVSRTELGWPDDRFVFLVTFDHLSVTERKNPIGAIDAFRCAFPEPSDDGPVLVVKSLNAAHRWVEHERVRAAAGFRPDITIVDRHFDRGTQLGAIAASDCLVSLHRSEGLGLHLIEAMWLGTPVIATEYSGNLHVMDEECAALVAAPLVRVERGEDYFPSEASWADPDLGAAAHWMRRIVAEPALRARLATAARARMQAQPTLTEAGARIAALLGRRAESTSPEGSPT